MSHLVPELPRWSVCYAPHSSMYFDQFGKVRACCQNTGVYLGDVSRQSIREIWESAEAEHLRTALESDDFSAGCDFCEWQVREGNEAILFARQYDELRPEDRRPRWPSHMEFSLTNTCNLACVMCNGDWSSTIRAKREGRDPIPEVYGEEFYEQLAEFVPHLDRVAFLGGEPFLGREPLRVMEMLAELADPPRVTITTNGTIYTERVRRIIELLDPSIVVSLDGASAATFDAIRVGAHFDEVIENLDHFGEGLGSGAVSLAHCLMTTNWHEFADLLALAEGRDLFVGVNVVRFPAEASLYQLDAEQLAPIVASMQATEVDLTGQRLDVWNGHVASLAQRLDTISSPGAHLGPVHGLPGAPASPPSPVLDDDALRALREVVRRESDGELLELFIDEGVITAVDAPPGWEWLGSTGWVGTEIEQLSGAIEDRLGATTVVALPPLDGGAGRFAVIIELPTGPREIVATAFEGPAAGRSGVFVHTPAEPRADAGT